MASPRLCASPTAAHLLTIASSISLLQPREKWIRLAPASCRCAWKFLAASIPRPVFSPCRSVLSANARMLSACATASMLLIHPSLFSNMILPTACFIACASVGFQEKTRRTSLAGNSTTAKVLLRLLCVSTKAHPQEGTDECRLFVLQKRGEENSIEDHLRRS